MKYTEIDGWFDEWDHAGYVQVVQNYAHGNFAEIGCWKGRSLCSIMPYLMKNQYRNIFAIDHWNGSADELETSHKEAVDGDIFSQFTENMKQAGYEGMYSALRMDSSTAASKFLDRYFNVVFIDGDHTYEGVMKDIKAWKSKVTPGGTLCGHDSHYPPVKQALNEEFGDNWIQLYGAVWAVII